ncbi:hypothetical protein EON65_00450 [archaeon]|nr:MAG: hypothetical protein EON65_00450 [archaeon]
MPLFFLDVCHEPLVRQRVSLINSSSSEENLRSQDEDEKSNGGKVGCSGGEDMYPLRIYTDGLHKREQRKLNNQGNSTFIFLCF